ncbi:MAG: DUF2284 domain-containing protein [Candidatus Sumerlaeia bacterium]|nr:DUF2284 domain-containing protein [Candidatus Sumerlaeia bacterium]
MTEPKPRERFIRLLMQNPEDFGLSGTRFLYTKNVVLSGCSRMRCNFDCLCNEKQYFHPPQTPSVEECRQLFTEYRYGLMFRKEVPCEPTPELSVWADFANMIRGIERQCFLDGYPRALAMAVGTCQYLHRNDSFRPCLYPNKHRPTFEALGIELLNTLEFLAWHEYAHRNEGDPFQLFALLMLE